MYLFISSFLYCKVLDHIEVICDYIKRLYEKGFAYVSPESGDINFDYEKFLTDYSIGNEMHAKHKLTTEKSRGKKSPKDFALWKVSKEGEPKWRFELNSELAIDGRPGEFLWCLLQVRMYDYVCIYIWGCRLACGMQCFVPVDFWFQTGSSLWRL